MVEYWSLASIVIGLVIVITAYIQARRMDAPARFLRDKLLIALVPMMSFIAVIELIIVPRWGTATALEIAPFGYFIWIASATLLMRKRSR